MIETTLAVEGMMCDMCASHISEAVRRACPQAKKVTSSYAKGQTVILSDVMLDEAALRAAIEATGYTVKGVSQRPYEKKGFFSFLKH